MGHGTVRGDARLRALAFWAGGSLVEDYEYDLPVSPCEVVVEGRKLVHYAENVLALYPDDPDMKGAGAISYVGVPLLNPNGGVLGHLAVMDTKPMPENPRLMAIFQIFAARASVELRRLRAEAGVREREAQLDDGCGSVRHADDRYRDRLGAGQRDRTGSLTLPDVGALLLMARIGKW